MRCTSSTTKIRNVECENKIYYHGERFSWIPNEVRGFFLNEVLCRGYSEKGAYAVLMKSPEAARSRYVGENIKIKNERNSSVFATNFTPINPVALVD